MTRPGTRLRALARRICDAQTMERLIDPAIADLQCEHGEAMRRGQIWRSRWARVAGYIALSKVAVIALSRGTMRAVRHSAAADDHALGRTVLFSVIVTIGWTFVSIGPALQTWWRLDKLSTLLVWYLVPQALQAALPLEDSSSR